MNEENELRDKLEDLEIQRKREVALSILWKHYYNESNIFVGYTVPGVIDAMIEFHEAMKKI